MKSPKPGRCGPFAYGLTLDVDLVALKLFWFQYTRADSPLIHLTKGQLKSLNYVLPTTPPMGFPAFMKWGLTLVADREWGRVVS